MGRKLAAMGLALMWLALAGIGCDVANGLGVPRSGDPSDPQDGLDSTTFPAFGPTSDSCGSYAYPGPCLAT